MRLRAAWNYRDRDLITQRCVCGNQVPNDITPEEADMEAYLFAPAPVPMQVDATLPLPTLANGGVVHPDPPIVVDGEVYHQPVSGEPLGGLPLQNFSPQIQPELVIGPIPGIAADEVDTSRSDLNISFPTWPLTHADAVAWYEHWDCTHLELGLEPFVPSHGRGVLIPALEITKNEFERTTAFHSLTQLADGRISMLLDIGSVGQLTGSVWAVRTGQAAMAHGRIPEQITRDRPLNVSGVGSGSQTCHYDIKMPLVCKTLSDRYLRTSYNSPCVPDSELPALFGLDACQRNRALIDTFNKVMYLVGPGEFNLDSLPPGSEAIQLETAPSGHLVVPCGYYAEYDRESSRGGLEIERTLALQAYRSCASPTNTSELFGSSPTGTVDSPAPSTDSNREAAQDLTTQFSGTPVHHTQQ